MKIKMKEVERYEVERWYIRDVTPALHEKVLAFASFRNLRAA